MSDESLEEAERPRRRLHLDDNRPRRAVSKRATLWAASACADHGCDTACTVEAVGCESSRVRQRGSGRHAAVVFGDQSLAEAIAQAGEIVGMPWSSSDEKSYWGSAMPIGDVMVAYVHVARPWFSQQAHHPSAEHPVGNWRRKIHAVSTAPFSAAAAIALAVASTNH